LQRSDQSAEKSAYLLATEPGLLALVSVEVTQADSDLKVCFHFDEGAACDRKVTQKILAMQTTVPFGNVGWNRDGRAADLAGQTKQFLARKPLGQLIHFHDQIHATLPNLQVSIRLNCH